MATVAEPGRVAHYLVNYVQGAAPGSRCESERRGGELTAPRVWGQDTSPHRIPGWRQDPLGDLPEVAAQDDRLGVEEVDKVGRPHADPVAQVAQGRQGAAVAGPGLVSHRCGLRLGCCDPWPCLAAWSTGRVARAAGAGSPQQRAEPDERLPASAAAAPAPGPGRVEVHVPDLPAMAV